MKYLENEELRLLPANIYKTYSEYMAERTESRKLSLLLDTFKQTVHFFGCVFLSEYLYNDNPSDTLKNTVNKMIPALARPSLGAWFAFMRDFYKKQSEEERFVKGFSDAMKQLVTAKNLKVYTGRFRKENSQGDVFGEIISLRNNIAHGAVCPDENEAKEIVEVYSTYLDMILRGFLPVFKQYSVVKLTELEDNYDSFTAYFNIINYDVKHDDRYPVEFSGDDCEKYFPDSDEAVGNMFLLSEDGRLLKLAEYLLEIPDDAEHEDYYLFDGLGNKDVVYLGMRYKKYMREYLEDIQNKFRERGASTKWTKDSFDIESFKNTLDNLLESTVGVHKTSMKYNPDVYVKRACDNSFLEFMDSDKTTMVVTAEAGVGKTNFLCHAAEQCKENNCYTYMFNGNTLVRTDSESILYDRMKADFLDENAFPNFGEFLNFFNKKNKSGEKFVLLLDAVNEAYQVENVLSEVDRMTSLGENYPWLKIILTIRTVSFDIFKNRVTDVMGKKLPLFTDKNRYFSVVNDGEISYRIEISEWNMIQTGKAFEKYSRKYLLPGDEESFHKMNRELKTLLMNPLNMSLYFEARSDEFGDNAVIRDEYDLFDALEQSWGADDVITESVRKVRDALVDAMLTEKTNELDADQVRDINEKFRSKDADDIRLFLLSPYERLKDLGVLYEKTSDQITIVAFVYQRYLEYLLMKLFLGKNKSCEEIAANMLEAGKHTDLPEEEIAWLQLLKKQQDKVSALKALFNKASELGYTKADVKKAAEELIRLAVFDGKSAEVADVLKDNDLLAWGITAAKNIALKEESDATEAVLKALVEKKEFLTPNELQEVYYRYGMICLKVSRHEEATAFFEKAMETGVADFAGASKVQLAKNLRQSGQVDKAKEILAGFLENADEETPYYADAIIQRGLCKFSDEDFDGALEDYLAADKIAKRQNENYVRVYNMLGISAVHREKGELDESERVLSEIYDESQKYGFDSLMSDSLNGMSSLFLDKGDYDKAVSYAKQGLIIWEHSKYFRGQMVMFCHLIMAYKRMGGHEEDIEFYKNKAEGIKNRIEEEVIKKLYKEALAE